jgi:hypothetical protein
MRSTSQTLRTAGAAITFLALLLLLALAAGAQTAAAAHFSDGSAATTPAAGTQGRGGVDGASLTVIAAAEPAAGTQGRGGASLAVVATTPAAGTAGRGGIAALPNAANGSPFGASDASRAALAFGRPRGALPVPQAGNPPTASVTSGTSTSGWVVAAVVAAIAAAAGIVVYAVSRRGRRREAPGSSYCALHPDDPLCGAA